MIVIVDFGMGNLRSILKKFEMIKVGAVISSKPEDILNAEKLVLPGVGNFGQGMKNIRQYGLLPVLERAILIKKIPILGVCLGMQLFAQFSEEGDCAGLGFIKGKITHFNFENLPQTQNLRIPHVGWNNIKIKKETDLLKNIPENTRFYFTHSYHYTNVAEENIIATTDYGYDFPSIIRQENIYGTQFHPEKSHLLGLEIYKNFINHC
ncbi:imidazole glycerol phosphate synthase subunit HisH [Candidatus Peregrinibacteria bacterium]|nr:imidazole glycerol phosphate synthase subunit HisH [Candidatus Peregrinibacteria bacterium]